MVRSTISTFKKGNANISRGLEFGRNQAYRCLQNHFLQSYNLSSIEIYHFGLFPKKKYVLFDMLFERPKRDASSIRRIKNWAYELLPIAEDAVISVMELECTEEGCPPVETIIAAMEIGKPTLQWKIHKPISKITRQNVLDVHQNNCSKKRNL